MSNNYNNKTVKKPWPTKAVMDQIYEINLWGGKEFEFYSGEGSHDPNIINPYIDAVILFLTSFSSPLTVCDLGCGDFNVGKEFVPHVKRYIAIDIVDKLIAHNKENYKAENLEFHCLDIAEDALPAADCVIIRQVLQHLSNAEVASVIRKLAKFRYVILTEHIPVGDFVANKDIISGQGIRIKKQSGLNLLAPPFNFQIKEEKELISTLLEDGKGKVMTTLYAVI